MIAFSIADLNGEIKSAIAATRQSRQRKQPQISGSEGFSYTRRSRKISGTQNPHQGRREVSQSLAPQSDSSQKSKKH